MVCGAPADLEPRKVAELPQRVTKATVGAGYYGYIDRAPNELILYRLTDGKRGVWTLPEGLGINSVPAYISENEVGWACSIDEDRGVEDRGGGACRVDIEAFDFE